MAGALPLPGASTLSSALEENVPSFIKDRYDNNLQQTAYLTVKGFSALSEIAKETKTPLS